MLHICPHCEKEITITVTYKKAIDQHDNPSLFIIKTVTDYFNTTMEKLTTRDRYHKYVYPRQIIFYLFKKHTKLKHEQMGEFFKRDRTTAMHGIGVIKHFLAIKDEKVILDIERINYLLN